MKIGGFLFFLTICLIFLGILLNETIHNRETIRENEELLSYYIDQEEFLNSEILKLQGKITDLTNQMNNFENEIQLKNELILKLNEDIEKQRLVVYGLSQGQDNTQVCLNDNKNTIFYLFENLKMWINQTDQELLKIIVVIWSTILNFSFIFLVLSIRNPKKI